MTEIQEISEEVANTYQQKLVKITVTLTSQIKKKEIQLTKTHQAQLRKINILFDSNAENYETIGFKGLYSLLETIGEREREREREQK